MGWTSTGDPYASVGEASLNFDTKENAVEFAEKYGWQYTVSLDSFLLTPFQTKTDSADYVVLLQVRHWIYV